MLAINILLYLTHSDRYSFDCKDFFILAFSLVDLFNGQSIHRTRKGSMDPTENITNEAIGNPLSAKSQVLETGASAAQVSVVPK